MAADTIFEGGQPSNPNIKAIVNPEHKPDTLVLTDCHRAVQVLMNLLANAPHLASENAGEAPYDMQPQANAAAAGVELPEAQEYNVLHAFGNANATESERIAYGQVEGQRGAEVAHIIVAFLACIVRCVDAYAEVAAYAYGNSSQVPYSEQFYVGGANSVRAFTVRSIGPGSPAL